MHAAVISTIVLLLSATAPAPSIPGGGTSIPPPSPVPITVFAAAVATLISCVVSCSLTAWLFKVSGKTQERRTIQDLIVKIIDISIAYPVLENDRFCLQWPQSDRHSEEAMRYDNYCCLVFNLIERLWKHCKGEPRKMQEILHYEELIVRHREWWSGESENRIGYVGPFRQLVQNVLKSQPVKEYLDRVAQGHSH